MNVSHPVNRRIGGCVFDLRDRVRDRGYPQGRILAALLALLLLGGCTSTPKLPTPPAPPTQDAVDGVPAPPRPGIVVADIPDAVVRAEPKSAYGNPVSYAIDNQRYYPLEDATGFIESGIASWYGSKFHGRRTSSGEVYDAWKMTAAHKTLPLPSYVSVQDIETGKRIVVRVNDRGPFHPDRIIDLSYAAAAKLGIAKKGTGLVEIRVLTPKDSPPPNRSLDGPSTISASAKGGSMVASTVAVSKPAASKTAPKTAPSPSSSTAIQKETLPLPSASPSATATASASASASPSASPSVIAAAIAAVTPSAAATPPSPLPSPKASTPKSSAPKSSAPKSSAPKASTEESTVAKAVAKSGSSLKEAIRGVFLQLASFRRQTNAVRLRDRLIGMSVESVQMKEFLHRGQRYYRVRVGPLPSREMAREIAGSLESLDLGPPLIVSE